MPRKLENVLVTDCASYEGHNNYCMSWEINNERYHIWLVSPDVLYCNPPKGTEHNGKGYFKTRKLNPSAKANVKMVADAKMFANANGLFAQADDVKAKKLQAERDVQFAHIALNHKKESAEVMYDVLLKVKQFFSCEMYEGSAVLLSVNEALAAATYEPTKVAKIDA